MAVDASVLQVIAGYTGLGNHNSECINLAKMYFYSNSVPTDHCRFSLITSECLRYLAVFLMSDDTELGEMLRQILVLFLIVMVLL